MKNHLFFCIMLLSVCNATAQHRDKATLLKLYERCASISQGQYTITERKKNYTNADTVLTRKKVYFINTANSNLSPPYSAKIIDLLSTKTTYVDSGGTEITYNTADSTKTTRHVNNINHIFEYFQPYQNRTNILYLNEYPEQMKHVSVEENATNYILTISIQQVDAAMGKTVGTSRVFFNKQTLIPEKKISQTTANGTNQYSEILISDYDFSAISLNQVIIPKNLPVKKTELNPAFENISTRSSASSLVAGQTFPAMKLPLHNGSVYNLAADSAKIYIVAFWYISCTPCTMQVNTLKNLQQKYAAAPVRILGVNLHDSAATVQNWMKKQDINYPSCVQAKQFAASIGIGQSFPVIVVLDEKRKVLSFTAGYSEGAEEKIEKQLKEVMR